eukprot:g11345.t1
MKGPAGKWPTGKYCELTPPHSREQKELEKYYLTERFQPVASLTMLLKEGNAYEDQEVEILERRDFHLGEELQPGQRGSYSMVYDMGPMLTFMFSDEEEEADLRSTSGSVAGSSSSTTSTSFPASSAASTPKNSDAVNSTASGAASTPSPSSAVSTELRTHVMWAPNKFTVPPGKSSAEGDYRVMAKYADCGRTVVGSYKQKRVDYASDRHNLIENELCYYGVRTHKWAELVDPDCEEKMRAAAASGTGTSGESRGKASVSAASWKYCFGNHLIREKGGGSTTPPGSYGMAVDELVPRANALRNAKTHEELEKIGEPGLWGRAAGYVVVFTCPSRSVKKGRAGPTGGKRFLRAAPAKTNRGEEQVDQAVAEVVPVSGGGGAAARPGGKLMSKCRAATGAKLVLVVAAVVSILILETWVVTGYHDVNDRQERRRMQRKIELAEKAERNGLHMYDLSVDDLLDEYPEPPESAMPDVATPIPPETAGWNTYGAAAEKKDMWRELRWFDWRFVGKILEDGEEVRGFVPDVIDQGECGSCFAAGLTGMATARYWIKHPESKKDFFVSETPSAAEAKLGQTVSEEMRTVRRIADRAKQTDQKEIVGPVHHLNATSVEDLAGRADEMSESSAPAVSTAPAQLFTRFSMEQQVEAVDYNQGCGGGDPMLESLWLTEYPGVTDLCWAVLRGIPDDVERLQYGGTSCHICEQLMMRELFQNGPLSLAVDMHFMNNDKRVQILSEERAASLPRELRGAEYDDPRHFSWQRVEHAVLLVGWGEKPTPASCRARLHLPKETERRCINMGSDEEGCNKLNFCRFSSETYWILQNSWGPEWGDEGHVEFGPRGLDAAFAEYASFVVRVRKVSPAVSSVDLDTDFRSRR